MSYRKPAIIFYIFFAIFSGLSLVYIPDSLSYKYIPEFSIVIILLPSLLALKRNLGLSKTLYITLIISLVALVIEYIGLITHFPYGEFYYNPSLSGQIHSSLPWTTGFSYLPFLLGAVSFSYFFTKKTLPRVIVSTILLLIFDLVIDPGAVAIGMWSYANQGLYYGVPLTNFLGWIVSGAIMSFLAIKLLKKYPSKNLLGISYSFCISIFLWTFIAFLKSLWIPFAIGIFLLIYTLMLYSKHAKNITTV